MKKNKDCFVSEIDGYTWIPSMKIPSIKGASSAWNEKRASKRRSLGSHLEFFMLEPTLGV